MTRFIVEYYDQESGRGAIKALPDESGEVKPLEDGKQYTARRVSNAEKISSGLRGLYRSMIAYPVKTNQLHKLPADRFIAFRAIDSEKCKIEKLHYIVRLDTKFIKEWNLFGTPIPRSTSDDECNNAEMWDMVNNAWVYLCETFDMTGYEKEWHRRRAELGKE